MAHREQSYAFLSAMVIQLSISLSLSRISFCIYIGNIDALYAAH